MRFKDLRTGELLADEIADIGAGVTWATDNSTVYYITVDAAWRPDTVWRYRIGAGQPAEQVYHEDDERFWLSVGRTRSDDKLIAAGFVDHLRGALRRRRRPRAPFTVVLPPPGGYRILRRARKVGGQDRFLMLHNDGAVNFTLVQAPVSDPAASETLIAGRDDVRLDMVDAFAHHLGDRLPGRGVAAHSAVADRCRRRIPSAAGDHLRHRADVGGAWAPTRTGTAPSSGSVRPPSSPRYASTTSTWRPASAPLREQPVLGDYRSTDYVEYRDWGPRRGRNTDPGVDQHRAGIELPAPALRLWRLRDVRRPALLHRPALAADRGMVFAVAHVPRGARWAGCGTRRKTAGEEEQLHRLRHRRAPPDRLGRQCTTGLVAMGGSAGGLLVPSSESSSQSLR